MTLVRKFLKSASATARTARFIVGTSKVVRVLWALCGVLLIGVLYACTAQQRAVAANDASDLAPYLDAGCALVDSAGNPWLDFICAGAEATDGLIGKLPQAKVVSSTSVVDAQGTPLKALFRVRCPLGVLAAGSDAATDAPRDVVTAREVVDAMIRAADGGT